MDKYSQQNLNTLCRACLQVLVEEDTTDEMSMSGNKYDIFQTPELVKKFIACTALNVEPTDEYPKQLCECCFNKVNEFHQFRLMCIESIERLRAAVKLHIAFEFEDEQPDFDLELVPKTKITVEDAVVHFSCDTVGNAAVDEKSVSRRSKRQVVANKKVVKSCKEDCSDVKLDQHELKVEDVLQATIVNCEDKSGLTGDECEDYTNSQSDDDDDSEAEYEHFKVNATQRKSKKNAHKAKRHKGDKDKVLKPSTFQCDICPARFFVEHRLVAHKRSHEGLAPYQCPRENCEKTFNRWHCLSEHLKQHEGTNNWYTCDVDGCDKVYKHKPTLVMHQRKFHKRGPELKSHVCEVCGKVFKASAILNDHRYTHKDKSELPHVCEQPNCSRRFSNKEKLKVHLMRHAGIKNFVCPYCGMRKTTRNELNIHINYHTLERTWPCRFCTHVCNSAGNLRMHVRTVHERAKDYACRHCDRTFAKPDTRKYHEMTHTGEKPNECNECGKRFTQPAALRTHRKIHLRQRLQAENGGATEKDQNLREQHIEFSGEQVVLLDAHAEEKHDANTVNVQQLLQVNSNI